MTNLKKITTIGIVALVMGATAFTAFASNYNSPAEAVAGLTGQSVENVIAQRNQSGNTYGMMASEAGTLEEFKEELLAMKEDALAARVAAGSMTQERADEIIAVIKEHQESCDGTDCTNERIGQSLGAGFGIMGGNGQMNSSGCQGGMGNRQGNAGYGQGLCDGSCEVE